MNMIDLKDIKIEETECIDTFPPPKIIIDPMTDFELFKVVLNEVIDGFQEETYEWNDNNYLENVQNLTGLNLDETLWYVKEEGFEQCIELCFDCKKELMKEYVKNYNNY